jgi:hypothetical protein
MESWIMETKYSFAKFCDSGRLAQEIGESAIVTALDRIEGSPTATDVWMKAELSEGDSTILTNLVTAHVATPLADFEIKTVALQSLPEPEPFAKPSFRTKRDKTTAWQTVTAGQTVDLDYTMAAERYVSGGEIIYSGAKKGDYVKASVMDPNGVIPAPYRAALCENHPLVNEYINGEWIVPNNTGQDFRSKIIDTYPLNAKITPGLVLRVSYTASAEEGDREVAVNYHLTKKL